MIPVGRSYLGPAYPQLISPKARETSLLSPSIITHSKFNHSQRFFERVDLFLPTSIAFNDMLGYTFNMKNFNKLSPTPNPSSALVLPENHFELRIWRNVLIR